ncbi:MAG: sodium/proton-translocating pyrophosphatase, partial [Anaerolineae bacterium]|nr:sodium/proton-translocating pyrophosphatase [Phycisphaerae bacterium]
MSIASVAVLVSLLGCSNGFASTEASLVLPDLSNPNVKFLGMSGYTLLMLGLIICAAGLAFGFVIYGRMKNLPVHRAMLEVSELIYETCKTYLFTQAKFIMMLWVCIAAVMIAYFGFLSHSDQTAESLAAQGLTQYSKFTTVSMILFFSLVGIAGSAAVAWFGMRVNTFANSRTAMASLAGMARPVYAIPLEAGMSIGMVLISLELLLMLVILLFVPRNLAGPCFIGFAIGESLGAAALRVAGGIFTKIADIGADLMKIVFKIKEDDARNPGVIADCVGDNAGDSVGPTADGFETYGVTGVALITFILLAVGTVGQGFSPAQRDELQVQLLVWIFAMRLLMVVTSALSYFISEAVAKAKYATVRTMNFEAPLTALVWVASITSILGTYLASYLLIGKLNIGGTVNTDLWWILSTIITCGTLAGAVIPEVTKIFTSVHSRHVREVVTASKEGGASLNVLSGLIAGNFSGFWVGGITIGGLMAVAYGISLIGGSETGLASIMIAQSTAIFAFGLVAFGFLGMGPVTIAVDSYGPVTDNAQSVYELSLIEEQPGIKEELQSQYGITADFAKA